MKNYESLSISGDSYALPENIKNVYINPDV